MNVIPNICTDLEEFPELGTIYNSTLKRVAELMEIHDIVEIRRVEKGGVFNHKYPKDIVVDMGIPGVPKSLSAIKYAVAKVLLDYLAIIGITGVTLRIDNDDAKNIMTLWNPHKKEQETKSANPERVPDEVKKVDAEAPAKPEAADSAKHEDVAPAKETEKKE